MNSSWKLAERRLQTSPGDGECLVKKQVWGCMFHFDCRSACHPSLIQRLPGQRRKVDGAVGGLHHWQLPPQQLKAVLAAHRRRHRLHRRLAAGQAAVKGGGAALAQQRQLGSSLVRRLAAAQWGGGSQWGAKLAGEGAPAPNKE